MGKDHLAAVCGLYCGACVIYRVRRDGNAERLEQLVEAMKAIEPANHLDNLQCDGCLAGGRLTPYCQKCLIRICPDDKPGVERCSDCPDFPCSRITAFNNDGMRHHAEVFENLRRMNEKGVIAWLEAEEKRWLCPQCQAPVDWYARSCFHCGTQQPRRLPKLPADKK